VSSLDYNILFALITSFLITYVAIPKVIFFAQQFRLTDVAGKRAAHEGSTPVFGGIAIFSGIIFSLLFWAELENIQYILVSILIVFFVGVIDDLLVLSPFKKLVGQVLATLILIIIPDDPIIIDSMHGVLGIQDLPILISTLFTIFVVIVITNGFNLIDGVDGLAAGVGIIAASCFGFVAVMMEQNDLAFISFSLAGALLAFLRYNFNPAKIFMGDTGSLVVGMILSVLAINIIKFGLITEDFKLPNKGPLMAIVFLAIPLFDSLRVFIARIMKGHHPLYPGREHIHHALLDLGFGHTRTALILYFTSVLLILGSYFLLELNVNLSIAILALISYFLLLIPFYILRKRK
jgi:UDP-N-acetylmuramyl pentapeptide phosphotransferase/UDP-N-acetylglucosamine-1-phosphate transferase